MKDTTYSLLIICLTLLSCQSKNTGLQVKEQSKIFNSPSDETFDKDLTQDNKSLDSHKAEALSTSPEAGQTTSSLIMLSVLGGEPPISGLTLLRHGKAEILTSYAIDAQCTQVRQPQFTPMETINWHPFYKILRYTAKGNHFSVRTEGILTLGTRRAVMFHFQISKNGTPLFRKMFFTMGNLNDPISSTINSTIDVPGLIPGTEYDIQYFLETNTADDTNCSASPAMPVGAGKVMLNDLNLYLSDYGS